MQEFPRNAIISKYFCPLTSLVRANHQEFWETPARRIYYSGKVLKLRSLDTLKGCINESCVVVKSVSTDTTTARRGLSDLSYYRNDKNLPFYSNRSPECFM